MCLMYIKKRDRNMKRFKKHSWKISGKRTKESSLRIKLQVELNGPTKAAKNFLKISQVKKIQPKIKQLNRKFN